MDLMTVVTAIPGVGPYLPYLAVAVAVCAALATTLKSPSATSQQWYVALYSTVNFVAFNFGNAKNATTTTQGTQTHA